MRMFSTVSRVPLGGQCFYQQYWALSLPTAIKPLGEGVQGRESPLGCFNFLDGGLSPVILLGCRVCPSLEQTTGPTHKSWQVITWRQRSSAQSPCTSDQVLYPRYFLSCPQLCSWAELQQLMTDPGCPFKRETPDREVGPSGKITQPKMCIQLIKSH